MDTNISTEAKVIDSHQDNIDEIILQILQNKLVAISYGKKERRVFAIVGLANDAVVQRMKQIKGRAASQAVAISGIPDVAPLVAELDKTPALVITAERLKISPQEVVNRCFKVGGVGLVLMAQEWLPVGATMVNKQGKRTVLIAGEANDEDYDIFTKMYRYLIEHHQQVMVGTSANIHGEDTYHILQQGTALEKLKNHVDLFVFDKLKMGINPFFRHLTSTTMIDLTDEKPAVIRWGSLHPSRFTEIFPDLVFDPKNLKKYKGQERNYHVLAKKVFSFFGGKM